MTSLPPAGNISPAELGRLREAVAAYERGAITDVARNRQRRAELEAELERLRAVINEHVTEGGHPRNCGCDLCRALGPR